MQMPWLHPHDAYLTSYVTRRSANPFNHQFFSDHQGIYVNLELEGLFDHNLPPLARPPYCDFQSASSQLIWTYIMELKKVHSGPQNCQASRQIGGIMRR
jgi:hypothetical protein